MAQDQNESEWRARELSEQTAQQVVDLLCQRLGIEDLQRTRRNLDYLAMQAEQALARQNDTRHTVYKVIGGLIMLLAGYVGAALAARASL